MANGVPIMVRVPEEIGKPLIARAIKDNCTVQAVLLSAAAHYLGVETPLRKRGGQPAEVKIVKPRRRRNAAVKRAGDS